MIDALYSIGLTDPMITSIALSIVIIGAVLVARRRMEMIPKARGMQNIAEISVGNLHNFFTGIMGEYGCKKYFPLVATLFIYIIFCNYSGLLPFSGVAPGFQAPTSSINFPAGMAIMVFIIVQFIGIKHAGGLRFYKHLLTPLAFLLPLNLVDELIKPLTLTLRLYGNTYGDEQVVHVLFEMVPLGLPVAMQLFVVLLALIQALVFSMLTAIYIGQALEGAEHVTGKRFTIDGPVDACH